jgi:hypothetical protein
MRPRLAAPLAAACRSACERASGWARNLDLLSPSLTSDALGFRYVWEALSHEVGHTGEGAAAAPHPGRAQLLLSASRPNQHTASNSPLHTPPPAVGLWHDGLSDGTGYYSGSQDWAPIMVGAGSLLCARPCLSIPGCSRRCLAEGSRCTAALCSCLPFEPAAVTDEDALTAAQGVGYYRPITTWSKVGRGEGSARAGSLPCRFAIAPIAKAGSSAH